MRSDDDLMAAFRQGERRAFDELFERYRDAVWGFFRRRGPDPADAEELAQDVFLVIVRNAGRYESRGAFRSYLFGICFRVLSGWRRATAAAPVDAADAEPADRLRDPAAALWVRRALAALDDDDREVLMLREYEQLRYDEMAAVLGVPLNTVRSRLFRARAALRAELQGERREKRG